MSSCPDGPTRRIVLGGLLAGAVAGRAAAEAPEWSLRPPPRGLTPAERRRAGAPEAEALIAEARLGGAVTFALADARTGLPLEGRGGAAEMPPASVAKAITALYGLETLGAGHRFRTQLFAGGPLRNGRIDGDLVLTGSGDPTLGTDHLADMAVRLKAAGVREVGGRFVVHAEALPFIRAIDPAQPDHVGYNPAISGLNLNFNRVHFEWKRRDAGYDLAMDARSERIRPAVSVARMRVAERATPLFTHAEAEGFEDWTVARTALGNAGSRWLPVRRPADYAGDVFRVLARAQGIALPPPVTEIGPARGTLLAETVSNDLTTVLTDMLKWSTNLTAEVIGLSASAVRGGLPATLAASGLRMGDWLRTRATVNGVRFVDHSGLGDMSRITADDMVAALVKAGADGPLRRMLKRIEMKDAEGRTIRGHPATVVAKTGTLNFVSGLAGFVQTPSGRVLAFAIFSADLARRGALAPDQMERPAGGVGWARAARTLQQKLIERWVAVHDA